MTSVKLLKQINLVLFTLTAVVLAGAIASSSASAETQKCYGQYGQEIPCPVVNKSFSIEKSIISGDNRVEEIRVTNTQEVSFAITVKNTGELTADEIVVIDNLPTNLTFVRLQDSNGQTVSVNVDQNSISWTITNFSAGQEKFFTLVTKTNTNKIAENQERCVTNVASILYRGTTESSNTASVCITNKPGEVLGEKDVPTVLPETAFGSESILGLAVVSMILGLIVYNLALITELKAKAR